MDITMNLYESEYERAARLVNAGTDSVGAKYFRDQERQYRDMLRAAGGDALLAFQEEAGKARQIQDSVAAMSGLAGTEYIRNATGHAALFELQEQVTSKATQTMASIAAMSGFTEAQDMLKSLNGLDLLQRFEPERSALSEFQRQATAENQQIKDSILAFLGTDGREQFSPSIGNAYSDFLGPSHRQAEQIKQSIGTFSGFEPDKDALKAMSASDHLLGLSSSVERALRALQPTMLPAGEAFASALLNHASNIGTLSEFEQTFAGQLVTMARDVVEAADENVEERVEKLTKLIGGQIASSKRTVISTEAWVQIVIAVMFFLQNVRSSQQSEARVQSQLQDIETQLRAVTAIHKVDQRRDLQLVAAQVLRVRAEPRADAAVVGKLTQNTLVCVLDEHRYWACVEYFDYLDGKTKEGWVAKRHLKNLPDEFIK
jgi:hypothetical protein